MIQALPLEYLERLAIQNRVFGDDIRLEGVAAEGNKIVVVTSQPILVGQPTTEQDISVLMVKLWFKPLVGLHLGRPGALAFYRELDDVAAFDAHPGNFVTDTQNIVLPIDLERLKKYCGRLERGFLGFGEASTKEHSTRIAVHLFYCAVC